jgi:nitrate reductase NapAB chaperone NapD
MKNHHYYEICSWVIQGAPKAWSASAEKLLKNIEFVEKLLASDAMDHPMDSDENRQELINLLELMLF